MCYGARVLNSYLRAKCNLLNRRDAEDAEKTFFKVFYGFNILSRSSKQFSF